MDPRGKTAAEIENQRAKAHRDATAAESERIAAENVANAENIAKRRKENRNGRLLNRNHLLLFRFSSEICATDKASKLRADGDAGKSATSPDRRS